MKFELIANIIYQGLVAYTGRDARKNLRQFKDYMEDYYAELDKPSYEDRDDHPTLRSKDFRNNNVIDGAVRGVYILGKSYSFVANEGQDLRDLIKK